MVVARIALEARKQDASPPSYPDPPAAKVPDVQLTESKQWPGALHKKIRYGPYRIPPLSVREAQSTSKNKLIEMQEENMESAGMNQRGIANLLTMSAKKPCTSECVVHSLTSALEYADGSPAEVTTGVSNIDLKS
jgi:hypothetical protein